MQVAGMRLIEAAKQNGQWEKIVKPPEINLEILEEFKTELEKNPKAGAFFESLTQSQKKQFIVWINMARRVTTREKRISESIELLMAGNNLGLK
jgi:uncharacterized protein YdeI (YjbR/CyaY-like superfamily)